MVSTKLHSSGSQGPCRMQQKKGTHVIDGVLAKLDALGSKLQAAHGTQHLSESACYPSLVKAFWQ